MSNAPSITFAQCGAESHPSFSQAILVSGKHNPEHWVTGESTAVYRIDYPQSYAHNKRAYAYWIDATLKHLRSFGCTGIVN